MNDYWTPEDDAKGTNVDRWLELYAKDDNNFWRSASGHHQNVIDELIDRLEQADQRTEERICDLLISKAHTDEYCDFLHFCYEQEAERYGWKTQERTRVAWKDLPVENQNTMRMAVFELVLYMLQDILGEEKWAERVDTANPKRIKGKNK